MHGICLLFFYAISYPILTRQTNTNSYFVNKVCGEYVNSVLLLKKKQQQHPPPPQNYQTDIIHATKLNIYSLIAVITFICGTKKKMHVEKSNPHCSC